MLKYILGLAFFCLVFLPEKGIAQWSSPPIILGADHRIPIDSLDTDGNGAVDIEAPGHYYLRENLMVNSPSGSGILIDSDNVNIDLNGYAILAGQNEPNDGIRVLGGHNNITIKNGSIIGFDQYGIDAIATKSSTFRNLLVKDNGFDGIIVDYDCLIVHCTALNNGRDGIEADDGSIIRDCTAAFNEGNGIEAGDGCLVFNCMAYGNGLDGIDVDNAVRVEGCTAHDNLKNGIDLINGALCINNTAYRNGEHGIECGLGSFIVNNASNDNGWCMANNSCLPVAQGTDIDQGAGIVGSSNTVIKNNQCLGNYFGILVTGFDMTVIGNQVQDNAHAGIMGLQSGILIIKNTTANNGCEQAPSISNTNPTNGYPLGEITLRPSASNGGAFGPIIDISTGGDLSTVTGATHPFANFID